MLEPGVVEWVWWLPGVLRERRQPCFCVHTTQSITRTLF